MDFYQAELFDNRHLQVSKPVFSGMNMFCNSLMANGYDLGSENKFTELCSSANGR